MDPVSNPFAPGAGTRPPELAGRDQVIGNADIALQRIIAGRSAKPQILTGLRGTGKTVLLNRSRELAESRAYLTSFIEAPEDGALARLIYPQVHQVLRSLSATASAKAQAHAALRALRSFASAFKVEAGGVAISVEPEAGAADSGNLELDLCALFLRVGRAARSAGRAWCLLIDELQYLRKAELAALIVALHRLSQESLPVLFFGAGLPHLPAKAGEAKSYAERLFDFTAIGPLDAEAARKAIRQPIANEGQSISASALERLLASTGGYPYFLQEWGFHAWNLAERSPIGEQDVAAATKAARQRLDEGFFLVRYDRLTPKERDYVIAMAGLGKSPCSSSEVAARLGTKVAKLSPRRESIIGKGVIYSPARGKVAFTVPMFNDFVTRTEAGKPSP